MPLRTPRPPEADQPAGVVSENCAHESSSRGGSSRRSNLEEGGTIPTPDLIGATALLRRASQRPRRLGVAASVVRQAYPELAEGLTTNGKTPSSVRPEPVEGPAPGLCPSAHPVRLRRISLLVWCPKTALMNRRCEEAVADEAIWRRGAPSPPPILSGPRPSFVAPRNDDSRAYFKSNDAKGSGSPLCSRRRACRTCRRRPGRPRGAPRAILRSWGSPSPL